MAASRLEYDLNEVSPVFGKIKTQANTYAFLAEADSIITHFQKMDVKFCFLPDNALLYPLYKVQNPLPVDWVQMGEIVNQLPRVTSCIDSLIDQETVFVVQKYYARDLYKDRVLIRTEEYPYMTRIEKSCNVVGESKNFLLYQKNSALDLDN